jgi:hypothetical protein
LKFSNLFRAMTVAGACAIAMTAQAEPKKPAPAPPPPPPLGPELWRGARIFMSQAEVAALFPTATGSKGELLPNGARSGLTLATNVAGAPVTAQFYFDANGLVSVIIDRPDVVAHRTDDNLVKAHRLIDAVSAQHGKPADCAEQPKVASLTCTWPLGETKAVVNYRDIGGANPTLSISYRRLNDKKPWAPRPVKKLKPR